MHWIEQQRQTMNSRHAITFFQKNNGDQNIFFKVGSRISIRRNWKRKTKIFAIFDQIKIMKIKSKKRNILIQKFKQFEFEFIIQDLNAVLQTSICQKSTTFQLIKKKKTSLQTKLSQKMFKAKRFANCSAKSLSITQRRGTGSRRSLEPAYEIFKTRNRRISRTLMRWTTNWKLNHMNRKRKKKESNWIYVTIHKRNIKSQKNMYLFINLIIILALNKSLNVENVWNARLGILSKM